MADDMRKILADLNLPLNRKTVKEASKFIYNHGGIQNVKTMIQKLKPPSIPPPQPPSQDLVPNRKPPPPPSKPPPIPPNPFRVGKLQTQQTSISKDDGYLPATKSKIFTTGVEGIALPLPLSRPNEPESKEYLQLPLPPSIDELKQITSESASDLGEKKTPFLNGIGTFDRNKLKPVGIAEEKPFSKVNSLDNFSIDLLDFIKNRRKYSKLLIIKF
jgi:hypothetical protein